MQELRFRAWDKEKKKMSEPFTFADLFGYEGECNAVIVQTPRNGAIFTLTEHNSGSRDGVIAMAYPQYSTANGINPNLVIMLSTGKQDKVGVEIFAGDKVFSEETVYEVTWDSRNADFALRTKDSRFPKRDDGYAYLGYAFHRASQELVVLGHIYENKEE